MHNTKEREQFGSDIHRGSASVRSTLGFVNIASISVHICFNIRANLVHTAPKADRTDAKPMRLKFASNGHQTQIVPQKKRAKDGQKVTESRKE